MSLRDFTRYLESLPTGLFRKNTLLTGDFNVCPDRDKKSAGYIALEHFLLTKGFRQLVKLPTYYSYDGKPSILDHIWTNVQGMSDCFIFDCPLSDHIPVIACFDILVRFPDSELYFRNFSLKHKRKFMEDADAIFSRLYEFIFCYPHTLNERFRILSDWLIAACNHYFPIMQKTVSYHRYRSPWLTTSIIKLIRKKHRLFLLFKQKKITYATFSTYCTLLKELLNLAESSYPRRRLDNCKFSPKRKWNHLNDILGRGGSETVRELKINDATYNNPTDIATHSNLFFKNVSHSNQKDMGYADSEFGLDLGNSRDLFCDFQPTTPNEIICVINQLKNNSLLSEIPTKFLKLCHLPVSEILSKLFNMCFEQSHYPSIFKIATIVPHFKAGDKSNIENYRPISHLPILNKIFETILHDRIYNFFHSCNIISNNQFGYMRQRSTAQAALKVVNELLPAIHDKNFAVLVLIDLSKAFDSVVHNLLLAKLHRYGMRESALSLLRSYLANRKQRVQVMKCFSEYVDVDMGVPQGSVLGPLLYIIFANDLVNLIRDAHMTTYADDIALTIRGDSLPELFRVLNNDLKVVLNWSRFNRLPINFKKCHAVIVCNKSIPDVSPLIIGNHVIPIKSTTNYLGIHINNRLNFSTHIEHVNSKLAQYSGITWRITSKLNVNAAKTFYFSFIFSLLSYGVSVWGGALLVYQCTRMHSLFRRVILNLFSWHFPGDSFEELCCRLNLLTPIDIYKFNIMTLYVNMKKSGYLPYVEFQSNVSVYDYRTINDLKVPFPRTNAIKANFLYCIPRIWNDIPSSILVGEKVVLLRDQPTISQFRIHYKRFLMQNFKISHGLAELN